MSNTNFQTIHQMGNAITNVMKQAMGRDNVQNIDMDFVTIAQRKRLLEEIITGNPVTFVTNIAGPLDYLIAQINPVQDLHGQEYPYPSGGGINQFDPDNVSEYAINSDTRNGHEYTSPGTYAVSAYGSGNSCYIMARVKNSDDTWEAVNYIVNGTNATLGAVITIEEGQKLYVYDGSEHTSNVSEGLFNSWKVQVALSSTIPNEYHTYSNVCSISGWDVVQITRTGSNLFDSNGEYRYKIYYDANGNIGTATNAPYPKLFLQKIPVLPNTVYSFSGKSTTNAYLRIYQFNSNDEFISRAISTSTTNPSISTTTEANVSYILLGPDENVTEAQFEKGNVSAYEPFGNVYPISLPKTAYGGTLTVNKDGSGTLIADVAISTITGSTSGVTFDSGATRLYLPSSLFPGIKGAASSSELAEKSISNQYELVTLNETYSHSKIGYGVSATGNVYIYNPALTSLEAWKDSLDATNLQIVYALATPVSYDFTASQILSLLGVNNIWADTGDVTVLYKNYEEVI